MITLIADNTKQFMTNLAKSDIFNNFLFHSLIIDTICHFTIDGQISSNDISTYISFSSIQPTLVHLFKQGSIPTYMKMILVLPPDTTRSIQQRTLGENTDFSIQGFLLTILFDGEKVKITTGTNYIDFTLDKSCESAFDTMIQRFFIKNNISMLDAFL